MRNNKHGCVVKTFPKRWGKTTAAMHAQWTRENGRIERPARTKCANWWCVISPWMFSPKKANILPFTQWWRAVHSDRVLRTVPFALFPIECTSLLMEDIIKMRPERSNKNVAKLNSLPFCERFYLFVRTAMDARSGFVRHREPLKHYYYPFDWRFINVFVCQRASWQLDDAFCFCRFQLLNHKMNVHMIISMPDRRDAGPQLHGLHMYACFRCKNKCWISTNSLTECSKNLIVQAMSRHCVRARVPSMDAGWRSMSAAADYFTYS